MSILSLEKRQGEINSISLKITKFSFRDTSGKTIVMCTYKFMCKLANELLILVANINPDIEEGDEIVTYGSPRWNNKFKILVVANLSKKDVVVLSKYGLLQIFAGILFFFTTLPLYMMFESGIIPDDIELLYLVISVCLLFTLVLLYKPFLIYRSLIRLKKEHNIEYRFYFWWGLPLFVLILIYSVNLISD